MLNDLFEMAYEYLQSDEVEILQFLSDLDKELEKHPEAIKDFIEEYIERNSLCSECFHDLEFKRQKEYRGECMGTDAYENVYYPYCPHCAGDDEEDYR